MTDEPIKPRLSLVPRSQPGSGDPPDPPEDDYYEPNADAQKLLFVSNRTDWGTAAPFLMTQVNKYNDPPTLFRRGDTIVELVTEPLTLDGQESPTGTMIKVDALRLAKRMGACVRCVKETKGEYYPCPMPLGPAKYALIDPGRSGLPELTEIVHTPMMLGDGTIVDKAGYTPSSKRFLVLPTGFRIIPRPPPSKEAAVEAYGYLDNLLKEFPFANAASRKNAVGAILGMVGKKVINAPYPLLFVNAPGGNTDGGNGKTLLCNALIGIAHGVEIHFNIWPRGETALRKQLVANVAVAQPATLFDNLPTNLCVDLGPLNGWLTGTKVQDRAMGRSSNVFGDLRGHQILANGNGVTFRGESRRRCVEILLDKPPRNFVYEYPFLQRYILEHQSEISASLLTILESWRVISDRDGPPGEGQTPIIKSFERWSMSTGSMMYLCDAGQDYLGNFGEGGNDEDTAAVELAFFETVESISHSEWVTAGEMWEVIDDLLKDPRSPILLPRTLTEMLTNMSDKPRALGNWLRARVGHRFGTLLLERNPVKNRNGVDRFRLTHRAM